MQRADVQILFDVRSFLRAIYHSIFDFMATKSILDVVKLEMVRSNPREL